MAKKTLPIGVTAVKNREGLYQLRVMVFNKRYSEYYSLPENTPVKSRNSILQKAIDEFREKCERGTVRGDITDRHTFSQAVEWYLSISQNRDSTIRNRQITLNKYVTPVLGDIPVRKITPAMLSKLFADLHSDGSKKTTYTPTADFVNVIKADSAGKIAATAAVIGIGMKRFQHMRNGRAVEQKTAELTALHYKKPVCKAFIIETATAPLSAKTVDHIANSISTVYTKLINNDVLSYNPVTKAEKPALGEIERGAFLNNETVPIFQKALAAIDNADIRILLTLCLECGLRNGEARSLTWENIDFSRRTINIRNSITKDKQGKEVIGLTKTKRSRRQLPLSPSLSARLMEHKALQEQIAAERGTAYNNRFNLVATNTAGNIMQLSALTYYMTQIRENNPELPADLHTHSLRHSFCSLLIAKGVNVVAVAALLGDTVEMVTKIYAHSFEDLERKAMENLADIFNLDGEGQALIS
jgi:integrase